MKRSQYSALAALNIKAGMRLNKYLPLLIIFIVSGCVSNKASDELYGGKKPPYAYFSPTANFRWKVYCYVGVSGKVTLYEHDLEEFYSKEGVQLTRNEYCKKKEVGKKRW